MNTESTAKLIAGGHAIPGVETSILTIPGFDIALRISIAHPVAPALPPAQERAPAIVYATDADISFGTVVEASRIATIGGATVPATIVGIGYADETGDLTFTNRRRFWDFYRGPKRLFDAGPYGAFEFGGADAFLAAIRGHVIPAVEAKIGAGPAPHRVLLGTSAGGHFAAYSLIKDPRLFQGIAMMSPILFDPSPIDDASPAPAAAGILVDEVETLSVDAIPAGLRVFLSAGELEEDPENMFAGYAIISNALRMRHALAQRGAVTAMKQFEGEDHGSVPGAAISRALRFLLPPAGSST